MTVQQKLGDTLNPIITKARNESREMSRTHQQLKSSFQKPYDMNLNETVDFFLNKPKFGMDNYQPRNLTLNQVPPKAFAQPRYKRETFMTTVPKLTQIVPAPCKYETTYDWNKKQPHHT